MTTFKNVPKRAQKPPRPLTLVLCEDAKQDFQRHLNQEKTAKSQLNLKRSVQSKLLENHSILRLSEFLNKHSKLVETQRFLYQLPIENSGTEIHFHWMPSDVFKPVFALDGFSYCLFTKKERKEALKNGALTKDVLLDLKRQENSLPKKSSKKPLSQQKIKQEPLDSLLYNTKVHYIEAEEENVDVFGSDVIVIEPTVVAVTTPVSSPNIKLESEESSKKQKRPSPASSHVDAIWSYNGPIEESESEPSSMVMVEFQKEENSERALKRYKKTEEDELDLEPSEVKEMIARIQMNLKLEGQLRELQTQLADQKLQETQRMLALQEEENRLKQKELDLLTFENKMLREKEAFYLQKIQVPSSPAPKAKSKRVVTKKKKTPPVAPKLLTALDLFVQPHEPVIQEKEKEEEEEEMNPSTALVLLPISEVQTPEVAPSDMVVEPSAEELLRLEQQRLAFEAYDRQVHAGLTVMKKYEAIKTYTGLGVPIRYFYSLREVLEKLLPSLPSRPNEHVEAILDNPMFDNYKVELLPNMTYLEPPLSPEQLDFLEKLQHQEIFNMLSPANRSNLSNLLIQFWFVSKAINYNQTSEKTGYRIEPIQNQRYSYAPEILHKWYPAYNYGNGTVITEDLKLSATFLRAGQGTGKNCCFCDQQFVACSNGIIKHSHQVQFCTLLSNLSNDERVIMNTIFQRMTEREDFASHPFIVALDEKCLLRRATQKEISANRYMTCPLNQERVRINMPILMHMRQHTYDEFLKRIGLYDTAADHEKNLNAKPIDGLMDCFSLTAKGRTYKKRMPTENGFLYRLLLDYEGNQFFKSKFNSKGETLRSFVIDPETGSGDGVWFSTPLEYEQQQQNQLYFPVPPLPLIEPAQPFVESLEESIQESLPLSEPQYEPEPEPLPLPVLELKPQTRAKSGGTFVEYGFEAQPDVMSSFSFRVEPSGEVNFEHSSFEWPANDVNSYHSFEINSSMMSSQEFSNVFHSDSLY